MRYPLPGPDFGGFRSFSYQLVADSHGRPLLLSNEIVAMYLGYCAVCKLQSENPVSFATWLGADHASDEAPPPDRRDAA